MGRRTIAALAVFVAFLPAALPAQEQVQPPYEPTSNVYANELRQILRDIDQIRFELGQIGVPPHFCLPPGLPSKREALDDLVIYDYLLRRIEKRLTTIEKEAKKQMSLPGAGPRLGPDYPVLNGIGPQTTNTNLNYWALARAPYKRALNEYKVLRKRIEGTEEIDCAHRTPPPPPVDWIEGLTPPTFQEISFLPLPESFCSWDEYWALLFAIHPDYNGAAANAEAAGAYRTKVYGRLQAAMDEGAEGATIAKLRADLKEAEADVKEQNDLSDRIAKHYAKAKKIPVVDCTKRAGEKAIGDGFRNGGVPEGTSAPAVAPGNVNESGAPESGAEGRSVGYGGMGGNGDRTYVVEFSPSGVLGHESFPTIVYLGFENSLNVRTFAVEHLADSDAFVGYDAEGSVRFGKGLRSTIRIGFRDYDVEFAGADRTIDPLGEKLLIPFVVQPGYAIGSNVPEGTPNGANIVTGVDYLFRSDNSDLRASYERSWAAGPGTLTGSAGYGYTWLTQEQRLSGNVPGFGLSLEYDTHVEVTAGRLLAGASYEYPWPSHPALSNTGGIAGSLNYPHADGTDRIAVSSSQPVSESRDVTRKETTQSIGVEIGSGYEWADGKLVFVHYEHVHDEITPVVSREGDGPSEIRFEPSNFDYVSVGVKIGW